MHKTLTSKKHQHGAVLIVSLIILLLMTLIGVSGMQTTTLEEKMASNNLDRMIALQAAEAALAEGETIVRALNNAGQLGPYDGNGADARYDGSFTDIWTVVDWTGSSAANTNEASPYTGPDVAVYTSAGGPPPAFVIEQYAAALAGPQNNPGGYGQGIGSGTVFLFRVTARGTSRAGTGQVFLQSIMTRRL